MEIHAPAEARYDEPCRLTITGLTPGAPVAVEIASGSWAACAEFVADHTGTVALDRHAPATGDWPGDASGHGPWWSATRSAAGSSPATAQIKTTASVRVDDRTTEVSWLRRTRFPEVTTEDLSGPGWHARRWRPPAGSSAPLAGSAAGRSLLWIGGSDGGFPRAVPGELLAARGIEVLMIAYFGDEGRPARLERIPVEAVTSAATALSRPPVVLGISRGSELALLAAAHFPAAFAGAIGIVPSGRAHSALGSPGTPAWTVGGVDVPVRTEIAVDRIPGPLLLLAAADDRMWSSADLARAAWAVRSHAPHPADRLVVAPDAGHTFFLPLGMPRRDPPEGAPHPVTGRPMSLGGTRRSNALAAVAAWTAIDEVLGLPPAVQQVCGVGVR